MVSPETLRRYPLFARQSQYMIEEIALICDEISLEAGDWLFCEEEEATKLYLVLDGAVSLTMYLYLNGRGQHLETMSPLRNGEIIGWSSLVKPHIYTSGAQAIEKTTLIMMNALAMRELLDDNPAYGYCFYKRLAEVVSEHLKFKTVQLLSMVLDSQGKPIKTPA